MGRYSRPIRFTLSLLDRINERLPFLAPRKCFKWTERERQLDKMHRAASICFVADLPI